MTLKRCSKYGWSSDECGGLRAVWQQRDQPAASAADPQVGCIAPLLSSAQRAIARCPSCNASWPPWRPRTAQRRRRRCLQDAQQLYRSGSCKPSCCYAWVAPFRQLCKEESFRLACRARLGHIQCRRHCHRSIRSIAALLQYTHARLQATCKSQPDGAYNATQTWHVVHMLSRVGDSSRPEDVQLWRLASAASGWLQATMPRLPSTGDRREMKGSDSPASSASSPPGLKTFGAMAARVCAPCWGRLVRQSLDVKVDRFADRGVAVFKSQKRRANACSSMRHPPTTLRFVHVSHVIGPQMLQRRGNLAITDATFRYAS
jgi:hypothetical protein